MNLSKQFVIYIIVLFMPLSWQLLAQDQFQFDEKKIEEIRWTPLPTYVANTDDHTIDLNGSWEFNPKPDQNFWKKEKGKNWESIVVPGEWVMQGYEVSKGEYAGYIRTFEVLPSWESSRVKLKCEAIFSECEIWINGKPIGRHLGGFTPFEFDVTDQVNTGKNVISIKVRSESLADTLSSASKYAVHTLGGITRSIWLLALPDVNVSSFHISTTFDMAYENANLNIDLKLSNESKLAHAVKVSFKLRDDKGQDISLGKKNTSRNIDINQWSAHKHKVNFEVKNPKKWDPEHPNLYNLECIIEMDGNIIQKTTRRFGFREIEVRGSRVFVNDKPIKLKGVCRHEVHPKQGRSLIGNIWEKDVKIFKQGNVNYIRTSHYPPNEKLLEACDELGLFVEVEAPFCWAQKGPVNDENYFDAILRPTLEMVERDRSHPSVLHWSLANESHDFDELFKTSADLIKVADPSRPRIFSQWGPQADNGYLELTNHHYPGPDGAQKYVKSERPIVFDEYCHLNAYNRFELMTDPGLRDFWGEGFYEMWEDMYNTPSILGGALWAGVDDTFFLPTGESVGYGTWGPIDSWRRMKPEFFHMKKVYSPVKIKLLASGDKVKLQIQNRYLFTNLKECEITWTNDNKQGVLPLNIEPWKTDTVQLPIKRGNLKKLKIQLRSRNQQEPVDEYVFDFLGVHSRFNTNENHQFSMKKTDNTYVFRGDGFFCEIEDVDFRIVSDKGVELMHKLPALSIIPLNPEGAGIQMTKETPEFQIFSPACSNRKIQKFDFYIKDEKLIIEISEQYDNAVGEMQLSVSASGKINLDYKYEMLEKINPRQWGFIFETANDFDRLNWQRKGQWSVYPEDHIGRNSGSAMLFTDIAISGLAGPKDKPSWNWNLDQTTYGSNDFRSTKRNIYIAELVNKNNSGLQVLSSGIQHFRAWQNDDKIKFIISDFDTPGAERFFRSHAKKREVELKKGSKISGDINLLIKLN